VHEPKKNAPPHELVPPVWRDHMSNYFIDTYVMDMCDNNRRTMRRKLGPPCRLDLDEACEAYERWKEEVRTPSKTYDESDAADESDGAAAGTAVKVESGVPSAPPFVDRKRTAATAFPADEAGEQGAWPHANGRARKELRKRLTAAEIKLVDAAEYASLKAHKHGEYSP